MIGLFFLTCLFSAIGCSQEPEDPAWFQSTTTGDVFKSVELITKINDVNSLFDLYKMKREYILRGGESKEIMASLDLRSSQLVKEAETVPAIPGKIDFVAWDIRRLEAGKYEVSGYFVVTGKMDQDWRCKFVAKVDDNDVDMLPPECRKSKRIRHKLYPKTSTWDVGEHKILRQVFDFQSIPYEIFGIFYLYPEKTYGNKFDYGWYVDTEKPKQ